MPLTQQLRLVAVSLLRAQCTRLCVRTGPRTRPAAPSSVSFAYASQYNHRFSTVPSQDSSVAPLTVTRTARDMIDEIRKEGEYGSDALLRLEVTSGGCSGFSYEFSLCRPEEVDEAEDVLVEMDDRGRPYMVCDRMSLQLVFGSRITWNEDLIRSSFAVAENPLAEAGCGCGVSFTLKPPPAE